MSTFPSVISTISDSTATNKLNSPSHSSIESAQNDAVKKIETFVGTLSSAVGTLVYDIRAVASDGGGHVQAANKGGTGQTTFIKGDILAASSSSVLSKLVVGNNNQVLTADSDQAAGVKWAGVANAIDIQNETFIYARASVMSGSVYGVKLSENPSILSDGLGLVIKFPAVPTSSVMALQVFTSSSGSVSALIKKTDLSNLDTTDIVASMIGVLKFESVSSVFQMINPIGVGWKVGTATKDLSEADQTANTYAHGLGRIPKIVKLYSGKEATGDYSIGAYDGTTNSLIFWDGTVIAEISSVYSIKIKTGGGTMQEGKTTVNATNIIITWTKTSTPTGTGVFIWQVS